MSNRLIAWLRTVVPTVWAAFVAWLGTLCAPNYITAALGAAGELVVMPIVLGVFYPLLLNVEKHLPDWLTRVLLGSVEPPSYSNCRDEPHE